MDFNDKDGDEVKDTGNSFQSNGCNQGDNREQIMPPTGVNNMNTKFNFLSHGTDHYSSDKPSNDVKADTSPVLTCAFSERATRVTSANYNPHAVEKNADIQDGDVCGSDITVGTSKEYINELYEDGTEQIDNSVEPDICTHEKTSFHKEQTRIFVLSNEFDSETELPNHEQFDNIDSKSYLKVSELSFYALDNGQQVNSLDNESGDIDPFEGLPIPRTRVCSFGQSSVYSVKEISGDLYRQYKEDMNNLLRGHGFFETFPDPRTVREAQQFYRSLDLPIPVDKEDKILPYPQKVTKAEYLASGENDSSIDFNIVHCVSIPLPCSHIKDHVM